MKFEKRDIINIIISLVVMLAVHYIYKAIDAPITSYFLPVIFLLVLIFLEVSDLNKKKK